MAFGFSVGDFIATGKLITDIVVILRTSARSEYQELMRELAGLQRALDHIEHLEAPPERQTAVVSIKVAALLCSHVLDEFAGKLKKFEGLASSQPRTSMLKIWTQKLRWGFTMADEVRNLRAYLTAHVGSLNMRLLTEGLSSAFVTSERVGNTEASLVKVHEKAEATTKITQSIQSTLESIATKLTSEVIPLLQTLVDRMTKVWQLNTRVLTLLVRMQESPTPVLQYTWFQAPVKFEDALGRVFPIPSEFDWPKVESIIHAHFSTGLGQVKVSSGEYELFDPLDKSTIMTGANFDGLRPGMSLVMAFIIGRYSHAFGGDERCPRPGCPSSVLVQLDGGRQCRICSICFEEARTRLPLPYRCENTCKASEEHEDRSLKLITLRGSKLRYSRISPANHTDSHMVPLKEILRYKNVRLSHLPLPRTPYAVNVRRAPKRKAQEGSVMAKRVRLMMAQATGYGSRVSSSAQSVFSAADTIYGEDRASSLAQSVCSAPGTVWGEIRRFQWTASPSPVVQSSGHRRWYVEGYPVPIASREKILCNQRLWKEAELPSSPLLTSRISEEHPDVLSTKVAIAKTYRKQERWGEAEKLYLQIIDTQRRMLGEHNTATLSSLANLALVYAKQQRWRAAEGLYRKVIKADEILYGMEHPTTLISKGALALTYRNQQRWEDSERLYSSVIASQRKIGRGECSDTLRHMMDFAHVLRYQGKHQAARDLLQKCFELRTKVLGHSHPDTLNTSRILDNWDAGSAQKSSTTLS